MSALSWSNPGGKAFTVAVAAICFAAVMALWPITNAYGTNCGTWIFPSTSGAAAEDATANFGGLGTRTTREVDSCHTARGQQAPNVLIFTVAAIVFAVAGFAQQRSPARESE